MASLHRTYSGSSPLRSPAPRLKLVAAPANVAFAEPPAQQARLSSLEWSIVAMAERDSLASLKEPGRLARALEALFGVGRPNKLANSRSETLRRIAVWVWRRGWNVPQSEIDAFVETGFTLDQFELIQASIAKSRENAQQRRLGR